ncbi:MAG TPA: hypothetical protein VHB77_03035 [Planctomycetaceae bacterium]|nr:hypothetical protein [Planctomycetaceae bacterium]
MTQPKRDKRWIQVFGWYGVCALPLAYGLLSLGHLDKGVIYQLLNLTGAAGIGIAAFEKRSYQAVAVEVVWAAIAITALIRMTPW